MRALGTIAALCVIACGVGTLDDRKLALDLGGLHPPLEGTIEMDALGLTAGESYAMDIFHAERHTNGSNFRIETTIACFVTPVG